MAKISYVRLYADAEGESHFEDVEVELASVDFAPPAPPLDLSAFASVERLAFFGMPAGWQGDWHPAPRRQFFILLQGEVEATTSDGEVRRFLPGSVVLVEDTTGKGHASRSIGGAAYAVIVQIGE